MARIEDVFSEETILKMREKHGQNICKDCVFCFSGCKAQEIDKKDCEMFCVPCGVTIRQVLGLYEFGVDGVWDKVKNSMTRESFEKILDKDWATQSYWGNVE